MKKLDCVDALIDVIPALKIAFVGFSDIPIIELLDHKLQSVDGEINAFIYDDIKLDYATVTTKFMPSLDKNFRTIAREYEALILNQICTKTTDLSRLLRTAFKALENSGNLTIIEDSIEGLAVALEEEGFVAINEIEVEENVKILTAKKMHGWGHGL